MYVLQALDTAIHGCNPWLQPLAVFLDNDTVGSFMELPIAVGSNC